MPDEEASSVVMSEKRKMVLRQVILWSGVTILALLVFSAHAIDSDEGIVLNAAWQLWHGKTIYVDFLEYITPGTAYVIFFIWKLFGSATYLAPKLLSVGLWIGSAWVVYDATKKIARNEHAAAFSIFLWLIASWRYPLINHNTYSSWVALLLLYVVIVTTHRQMMLRPVTLGLLSALAFLFLQTKGFAMLGATLVILWFVGSGSIRERFGRSGMLVGGFMLGLAPLFVQWNIGTLLYNLVAYPQSMYGAQALTIPWTLFVECGMLFAMILGERIFFRGNVIARILIVFQAALFVGSIYALDMTHVLINAFPFIIFAAWCLPRIFAGASFDRITLCVLVFTLGVFSLSPPSLFEYENIWYQDIFRHARNDILNNKDVQRADAIYAGPFMPGLYFELRKPNPFPVSNMLLCNTGCQKETIDIMGRLRPEFALVNYDMAKKFGYKPSLVDGYIRTNYVLCENASRTKQYPGLLVYGLNGCPMYRQ